MTRSKDVSATAVRPLERFFDTELGRTGLRDRLQFRIAFHQIANLVTSHRGVLRQSLDNAIAYAAASLIEVAHLTVGYSLSALGRELLVPRYTCSVVLLLEVRGDLRIAEVVFVPIDSV